MKEILGQLATIWRERNSVQKLVILAVLALVGFALSCMLFRSSEDYVPLFPGKKLSPTEMADIRSKFSSGNIQFQEDKKKVFVFYPSMLTRFAVI